MARIRTIKPEFWTSEQIVSCSREARLLFIGLWNFSDDAGIHPKSYKRLKMEVFPGDDCTEQDLQHWMNELIAGGLIIEYLIEQKYYWQVTGWKNHQKIDKPTYRHPSPHAAHAKFDEFSSNSQLIIDEDSSNAHRLLPKCSLSTHHRNGKEGNGEERSIYIVPNETLTPIDSSSSTQKSERASYKQQNSVSELQISNVSKNAEPAVFELFAHWQSVMGHPRAVLDARRIKVITQALNLGYTLDELKEAISGCANTPFNVGVNDSKTRYDDIGLILRDAAHIERYIQNNKVTGSANVSSATKLIDTLSEGAI